MSLPLTGHIHHYFEPGMIIMWSGSISDIPSGWALCDGTNGTPDLRDRMIVCAGSSFNPGDTGGSTTLTHAGAAVDSHGNVGAAGGHTHTSAGAHAHATHASHGTLSVFDNTQAATAVVSGNHDAHDTLGGHTHDTIADHQHAGPADHTVTQPDDHTGVRPPFYALAFIMRL